ncbi:MAG: hypothetical protein AAFX85_09620, partial [Pseudomonadota bacterium]
MNRRTTLLALAGFSALATASHGAESVTFQQLRHDAIGAAQLDVNPNGTMMRVTQMGPSGTDGFRVQLP